MLPASKYRSEQIGNVIEGRGDCPAPRTIVSAITAVRNEERHIESVLKSLLQQDAPDFDLELIIVDGDSDDGTRDVTQRAAAADPRVRLVINKQNNTPNAFNIGLPRAKGEYVCILGAPTGAQGWTLYITDTTSCKYFVSPTLVSLSRYAFKTGFWNFISLKVNPASMALRHFVPAVFVAVAILSLLAFVLSFGVTGDAKLVLRSSFLLLAISYSIASLAAAGHIAFRQRSIHAVLVPFGFLILHVSYGIGTLTAMARNARPPACEMSHT